MNEGSERYQPIVFLKRDRPKKYMDGSGSWMQASSAPQAEASSEQ